MVTPSNYCPHLAVFGRSVRQVSTGGAAAGLSSRAAQVLVVTVLLLVGLVPVPAEAITSSISGVAYHDVNRDGKRAQGEPVFEGHTVQLYDSAGTYVWQTPTDSSGRFVFSGLAPGSYEVRYAPQTWWQIREHLVPTTTGSVQPRRSVTTGTTDADFGWREIVRSTDLAAPLSEVVGPSGVRVASYNDAISAQEIHAALASGSLLGEEAPSVAVRFGYGSGSSHSGVITHDGTRYTGYHGDVYVSYVAWLDGGDRTLFHEYGHAWSHYHAYVVQQDPELRAYQEARGLAGDERLNTSYAWDVWEIIAEDYRHLFGSENARAGGQINRDIPLASEVPGLEDYLRGPFRGQGETPDPTSAPPAEDAAQTIQLTVSASKVRNLHLIDLAWTGVEAAQVDIRADGVLLATVNDAGSHRLETTDKAAASARYQVCDAGSSRCSAPTAPGDEAGGSSGGSTGRGGPKNR